MKHLSSRPHGSWYTDPSTTHPGAAALSFTSSSAALSWLDLFPWDAFDYAAFAAQAGDMTPFLPRGEEWSWDGDLEDDAWGIVDAQSIRTGTVPARRIVPGEEAPLLPVRGMLMDRWAEEMRSGTWEPFACTLGLTTPRPRMRVARQLRR